MGEKIENNSYIAFYGDVTSSSFPHSLKLSCPTHLPILVKLAFVLQLKFQALHTSFWFVTAYSNSILFPEEGHIFWLIGLY